MVYFQQYYLVKKKVIANLQLEAVQIFYDVLWIPRSLYCFFHRVVLHINYNYTLFKIYHKLHNIFHYHLLKFLKTRDTITI
jgi:hypothetical protein